MMEEMMNNTEETQEAPTTESPKDPQREKEVDAYTNGMVSLLYNKKTGGKIYEILKSGPPEETIPAAALTVNDRMETAIREKGGKPKLGVLLESNLNLMKELVDIGHAGGFFQVTPEQIPQLLQTTMQKYLEDGLAKGTVDPIELQEAIEPLLTEEQRNQGMQVGQESGVPDKPGVNAAMDMHAQKAVAKEKSSMLGQAEAKMRMQKGGPANG